MRIIIAGARGLIGSHLTKYLQNDGHTVAPLKRGETNLEGFDVLINLAGEPIAQRWTEVKKREIKQSRVETTRRLVQAGSHLKLIINASAIGYYGNRGEETVDESSSPGEGFLAEVTQSWEKALSEAKVPTIALRFGMVLSADGGALRAMLTPFKWGMGGIIGSGQQFISWIAIDDVVRAIAHLMQTPHATGPFNLVAPHPVRNVEFTKTLGKVLHRPTIIPIPELGIKTLFGEMGQELLLSSTKVYPKRLLESGFSFMYPTLEEALWITAI